MAAQGPVDGAGGEGAYSFQSEPHAVASTDKYRQATVQENMRENVNIMWDRRVVRGNTYAAQVMPAAAQPDPVGMQKSTEQRRLKEFQKRSGARSSASATAVDAVAGRVHAELQTDSFLEEISDKPVEVEMSTQTDAFMDRPPSPLFIPQKTGVDVETQIYENDLFDFDYEVEPILEVLVGKTMEQALMEVLEEEELARMRAHQDEFDHIRTAELAEVQRMEAGELRRREEKERRVAQEQERVARERAVSEKVAASGFARLYVGDVLSTVFGRLESTGFFYDPVLHEVEEEVVPMLMAGLTKNLEKMAAARSAVDGALADVLALRADAAAEAKAERDAAAAAVAAEAAAAEAAAAAADGDADATEGGADAE